MGAFSTINAQFDFRGSSVGQPADGFSMTLIPTATYGNSGMGPNTAESPNVAGTFGLGFHTYPGGTNDVSTHFDNMQQSRRPASGVSFRNGVMQHAQISIQQIGNGSNVRIDLTNDINGAASPVITPLHHYISGLVPYENRVQFSGRTGGANMTADFDNINVQYSNAYVPPPTWSANTLHQDFDSLGTTLFTTVQANTTPGPLVQAGGPTGNYLRLMSNVNSQNNRIAFDRAVDGGVSNSLKTTYDFRINTSGNPGDGYSILLLPTSAFGERSGGAGFTAEEPNVAGAFGVGFDLHPGLNNVSLHWNNAQVAEVTAPINLDANVFHRAEVVARHVAGGSNVTVTLTPDIHGVPGAPVTVFSDYFVPGMLPYDYRAQFSARSGGATLDVDLDNIVSGIAPGPQPLNTRQGFDGGGSQYKAFTFRNNPHPQLMTGGPTGNYLRLIHDGANDNWNSLTFDQAPLQAPAGIIRVTADFDFRAGGGGDSADGFSFLLTPSGTYGVSGPGAYDASWAAEKPNVAGLFGIGFDFHPAASTNDVSVHWNGVQLSNINIPLAQIDLEAGVFHHVYMDLQEVMGGALLDLILTPDIFGIPGAPVQPFASFFVPGLDLYPFRVEFAARSGGLNMNVDLDNIAVNAITPEPGTMTLLLLGGIGAVIRRRRRK